MTLSPRDYQLLALGWDKAVEAMANENGEPLEIMTNSNPYRTDQP